jgi:NAD(P)-dependent dehydrogenase (short-subunit alcohol dehydrogenase family)
MPSEQKILQSEVILEKYGKALTGKTILITGVSNDSIAGELAVQLSSVNPGLLILSARSESRVDPVIEKIKARNPNVATRFLKMDLGDLSDIRRAVNSLGDIPKIDHIAAVAGIMLPPYRTTVDGVESQFGVNYLANFLLVKLLLPKVEAAGPSSSIIIVASSAVRSGKIDFDDIGYSVSTPLYLPSPRRQSSH